MNEKTDKTETKGVSRRQFMAAAGATAGVAVATTYSPFSYALNEKVRVASIGTGGQGCLHLRDGLARAKNIEVRAVCDVYMPHLEGGWIAAGRDPKINRYLDYHEMLEKEELDAVVIATPLDTHFKISMDCLDAGKYVFCEKTMCYEIEHAREMVKKAHEKGLFVQVGHQRRYNPDYNHAMKLIWDEKIVGRIHHVDAQWHRNNDWRRPVPSRALTDEEKAYIPDLERHINWRLYREHSGGLMTELATHALDVVNWILDANPTRVCGYGGLDYWRDGRDVQDNINIIYEYEIGPGSRAFHDIEPRTELHSNDQLNKPYVVRVVYSSITANAQRGASEWIQGDEGTLRLTELGCLLYREPGSKVKWADSARRDDAEENALVITTSGTRLLSSDAQKKGEPLLVDTDRSVDQLQFEAFASDIRTKGTPRANAMVGLKSAVCALAGMKALRTAAEGGSCEVKIDPKWYEFDGFEPDDTSLYGPPVQI